MSEEWRRLGASSEMLALSSVGHTKNILVCLIDIRGPLNVEVLFRSARRAAQKYPQLNSAIRDTRRHGLHYLEWTSCYPNEAPVFFHDLSDSVAHEEPIDQILFILTPRLDRDWDLFREVPSEFHCIKLSGERFLIGWVIHHAAGDAALGSDVGRDTLQGYYETTHDCKSDWANEYLSFSGSKKRPVRRKKTRLSVLIKDIRQTTRNLFKRPTLPVGSGEKNDLRQHHSKIIFSDEKSLQLEKRLRSRGLSLIDSLVASSNYAIDQWNSERNVTPGFLTTSVSVNMRGRLKDIDKGNSSSLIFFESSPQDRDDSASFVRSIAIRRIHHFRNQVDLTLADNIKMMISAFRMFPFSLRRKIIGFITDQHEFSIAVTLLGVIWPKIEKGRLTSDSALSVIGDLHVEEVIGIPYKMLSKTKTVLTVYVFKKKLNFVLSTSASLFSKEENDRFLDLILEKLLKF